MQNTNFMSHLSSCFSKEALSFEDVETKKNKAGKYKK